MNIDQTQKPKLSSVEFALLGGGQVAYVRELQQANGILYRPHRM